MSFCVEILEIEQKDAIISSCTKTKKALSNDAQSLFFLSFTIYNYSVSFFSMLESYYPVPFMLS